MVAVMKLYAAGIEPQVLHALAANTVLEEADVSARVEAGTVTLTGEVDCHARRLEAERTVLGVPGVGRVVNEIRVVRGRIYSARDFELLAGAQDLLRWNYLLRGKGVHVSAANGWVVLSGIVATPREREEAERAISALCDLVGVLNLITVRAPFHSA